MAKKLYVGNLSFQATADQVRDHFANYGEVSAVNLITDSYSGRSRGFAFVEMVTEDGATKAREATNGKPFQERNLTVDWARPKTNDGMGAGRGGREMEDSRRSFRR